MDRLPSFSVLLLVSALGLSGCGLTYVSPLVRDEADDGVAVVDMTGESVPLANRAPYAPRELPDAFAQVAGGGSPRGLGALPDEPDFPDLEPGELELRVPPPATPGPYRIGVGDVIQLATRATPTETLDSVVTGEVAGQEVRQDYTVRDDGTVSVPQVGAVQVGGLTVEDAEQRLFEQFIEAGLDPNFSLEISGFNSQTITVGGAVGTPTALPVTLNLPSLDEALTAAGGVQGTTPEYASIRIYRDGTLYQIPYESYRQRGDLRGVQLLPGDAVFVDTSYDLERAQDYYAQQIQAAGLSRQARTAALTELSTEIGLRRAALEEARDVFRARAELGEETRDYVYLAGEVATQGRYPLPYGRRATLADALYDSGGGFDTETGNPSQIYVLRASADPATTEPVTAWHLDARNAANLILATQFEMRPNDIVFIEEQPITRWNRAFQQFFPSLISTAQSAVE
ncbi:Polysaccharide export protein [Rubellimicrobium mesophilum DSM 19309]|uniref:Polysaccharide export protein n=1 Tax=Rubellimicrobium mesophilum DSM 19309 TaxID=442562 RepID=A0A017HVN1_9RHOB|nr:polysaccharide biosynthesis/export family protein [Rubellimicrobium mesophilum]EYD78218.1 Polysaccharide export protein [Rubellimicrobium mesophilum DSM 19309]